jgi:hypothetical protein
MEGFLSKLIGLVLLFFLLIVAPIINITGIQESQDRMEILNDTCEFLDMVTDKRSITEDDLTEFGLKVASNGIVADVQVTRLVRISTSDTSGTDTHSSYVAVDDTDVLNVGDMVRVEINEISPDLYRRFLISFLRLDTGNYELSMAKIVK